MAGMRLSWRLNGAGWIDFTVSDDRCEASGSASYITPAPEDFLTAVTRLVLGEAETNAQFNAEPVAYRWRFRRAGGDAQIQLLQLPDSGCADSTGITIWSSRQAIDSLARATVRAFDHVGHTHSDGSYRDAWRSPFPRTELENLRRVWRQAAPAEQDATTSDRDQQS